MKIEKCKISDLTHEPSNVRLHGEKNITAIKSSLLRFGQQKPIVCTPEGLVIAGNGTLIAASELGWKEIQVVRTVLKGSDLTAFSIADNRTSELAEWDQEELSKVLSALTIEGIDVGLLGFTIDKTEIKMEDIGFSDESKEKTTIKIVCFSVDKANIKAVVEKAIKGFAGATCYI